MTSTEANAVVLNLYRSIMEGDAHEILKWYKEANNIMLPCVDDFELPEPYKKEASDPYTEDALPRSLHEEIWFRQLFAGGSSPTAEQRLNSSANYCSLLPAIVYGVTMTEKLPYQWLWHMVDEYVNQFESFCHYRAWAAKTNEDVYLYLQSLDASEFSVRVIFYVLHSLLRRSNIIKNLEQGKFGLLQSLTATKDHAEDAPTGSSNVPNALGYFGLVGMLRVHCLLGSYQDGLDCVRCIDIIRQGFHPALIATQIITVYHYGFANLMLGRYVDAIRGLSKILAYILKQPIQESPQILNKIELTKIEHKIEQIYALLAICFSLCPRRKLVDVSVFSQLLEKYGEKISRMKSLSCDALFSELLSFVWPTFSKPFAPDFGDPYQKRDKDGRVCAERSTPYAASFRTCASWSLVKHNPLELVIADMQDMFTRPTSTFKSDRVNWWRSKSFKTRARWSKVGLGFSKHLLMLKVGQKSVKNRSTRSKVS